MIGILDYGLGNINSFTNIIRDLNVESKLVKNLSDFDDCSHFILPGVGAFDNAMQKIRSKNFEKTIKFQVLEKKKPLLGICVGMQILGSSSAEGVEKGLNLIDGKIKKVKTNNDQKLPHMGWNRIIKIKENKILNKISEKNEFYFLHSYYFESSNEEDIVATTFYSNNFPVIVNRGKIYGIQFHPEKSHELGRKIIENFTQIF
ncbi:imidazole glycerol phosphate synthase subunit HisH [Candidatus Pelagibacter communis]|uniref:imidazole glycerol phosphate synthase subunit HisH n=1 Tax=Pelagibacter ubique TaxID=198252 RepID=UPI00094C6C0E|nr:imidazole glycerol phosphate synthase subunit HisH [Candidatus Pelagibacter ubique]